MMQQQSFQGVFIYKTTAGDFLFCAYFAGSKLRRPPLHKFPRHLHLVLLHRALIFVQLVHQQPHRRFGDLLYRLLHYRDARRVQPENIMIVKTDHRYIVGDLQSQASYAFQTQYAQVVRRKKDRVHPLVLLYKTPDRMDRFFTRTAVPQLEYLFVLHADAVFAQRFPVTLQPPPANLKL